ncbi:sugar ABC transporter permease [Plantactinospora sp. GCM10030261]|uniref:sugar ABC transporter permease n=1 Tax=Plantactinospora sp. GCM10030261 TaxID=3273420 RepID=UPI00361E93B6
MSRSTGDAGRTVQIVVGLLLTFPAVGGLLWSYVLPTINTVTESFGTEADPLGRSVGASGDGNYKQTFDSGFVGDVGFALLLAIVPLLLALVVAPLLALAASRAGRMARLATRALLALPLAAYAPLAVAASWTSHRFGTDTTAWRESPTATSVRTVALLTAGLVVAVSATLFLSVLRRPGRKGPALAAVGGVLGLAVVAVTVQSWSLQLPMLAGGSDHTGPMPTAILGGVRGLGMGVGAAGSTLLLALLAVLGLAAVALLLLTRTRITFTGWRDRSDEPAGEDRSPGALALTAVGLLAFVGVLAYVFSPWLGDLFGDSELPSGLSTGEIRANTWLPPLVSTVVGVSLAVLAGFGIGGLRPLGRASELLLLPFAPWLFVGDGPLALAHFQRTQEADQISTFAGLVSPGWLCIPALVVFTLFFRGQHERWTAGGRFASTMLVPALPLVAAAGLLTWLVNAQGWLWSQLVVTDMDRAPASNLLMAGIAQFGQRPERMRAFIAEVLPLPLLLFFLVAFVAAQVFLLDRLAIRAGRTDRDA